jgi:hypothetical protein
VRGRVRSGSRTLCSEQLTGAPAQTSQIPAPVIWGAVIGVVVAASPLAFWWLDPSTVYALGLVLIAAVYIGFAVADGRPKVIVAESTVASIFVVVAAVAVTGSVWLIVVGLVGHGLKDLWQHLRQFVANTRWWPPSAWSLTGLPRHSSPSRSSPG